MMLTMRGKGNDAPGGGVPGDLQIVIEEQPDEHLIRDDQDLIYNLMIDFPTAALGGKVEIPTIDGGQGLPSSLALSLARCLGSEEKVCHQLMVMAMATCW